MININTKKNILISAIILAVVLITITGSYLFYLKPKSSAPAATPPNDLTNNLINTEDLAKIGVAEDKIAEDATKGVLPDIQTNPLDAKPDLNPVDKTNPYKNIKTNPFK